MRDIAIVAYSQSDCVRRAGAANEVELIMPQLRAVFDQVGLSNRYAHNGQACGTRGCRDHLVHDRAVDRCMFHIDHQPVEASARQCLGRSNGRDTGNNSQRGLVAVQKFF